MYYALFDNQCGKYLQTGLNSKTIEDLFESFVDYYFSNDSDEQENIPREYMEKYNHNTGIAFQKYLWDTNKNNLDGFFNSLDFVMEKQNEEFDSEW